MSGPTSAPSVIKKEQVFAVVLHIKKLCEQSRNGETICLWTLSRLRALVAVVQQQALQNPSTSFHDVLESLNELKDKIKRLSRLNQIFYLAEAAHLHNSLFDVLNQLSLSLVNLTQRNHIMEMGKTGEARQQQQQKQELRDALNHYFSISEQQDSAFAKFQQAVSEEQNNLAAAADFSSALQQILGPENLLKEKDWEEALRLLQHQVEVVTSQLTTSEYTRGDPMVRSRTLKHQEFLNSLVEQVAKSMPPGSNKEPIFPAWALDPLTHKVMTEPVIVRAPCNHTLNKSSFEDWLEKGNKTCPVCGATLKALYATPNRDMLHQLQQLSGHAPGMDRNDDSWHSFSSLNTDWREVLGLAEGSRGSVFIRAEEGDSDSNTVCVGNHNASASSFFSNSSPQSKRDSSVSRRRTAGNNGLESASEHSDGHHTRTSYTSTGLESVSEQSSNGQQNRNSISASNLYQQPQRVVPHSPKRGSPILSQSRPAVSPKRDSIGGVLSSRQMRNVDDPLDSKGSLHSRRSTVGDTLAGSSTHSTRRSSNKSAVKTVITFTGGKDDPLGASSLHSRGGGDGDDSHHKGDKGKNRRWGAKMGLFMKAKSESKLTYA